MRERIDFSSVDAARFNALRDQWRGAASGGALSKAGLRVAAVLPGYVSREHGYAWPTDEQLAEDINADKKTVKRGLSALDDAHLIDRIVMPKRGDKGEVTGKTRRIFLCLPTEGTLSAQPKGQDAPPPKGQNDNSPKGHFPKGQDQPKGQKSTTEGTPVCPYIPDTNTPDTETRSGTKGRGRATLAREGYPPGYAGDDDFLDAFDQIVVEMTDGRDIGAGELGKIVQVAFDRTTDSSDQFMPFHWADVCKLRKNDTELWFIRRAGQLVHAKAVA